MRIFTAILLVGLAARLAWRERQVGRLAAQARAAALVTDSARAVADTTVTVRPGVVRRRVVQTAQAAQRAARYALTARVSAVDVALPSTPGVVRMEPFTVTRTPSARDIVRIELDTVQLEAHVGCGAADASGVRPATLTVAGPTWISTRLTRLEQEPRVCSPAPWRESVWRRLGVSVGYSALLAPDGRIIRGPSVGVAWRVWP
jgi:hypothetical protein